MRQNNGKKKLTRVQLIKIIELIVAGELFEKVQFFRVSRGSQIYNCWFMAN